MKQAALNAPIPEFSLESTAGKVTAKSLQGQIAVLYFYPRDNTPGCTLEGQQFRDLNEDFKRAGARVYGVSRDSLASHHRFCEKQEFPFVLISDPDETLCNIFNVMRDKNMYGKKVRGIERSTFLIDAKGVLSQEWRKVKPEGHAAEVLKATQELG